MGKEKPKRQRTSDLSGVEKLLDELKKFNEEFDVSDPGLTEVSLDTRISNLIERGAIKKRGRPKNLQLNDVFKMILKDHAPGDLLERVQTFQDLINNYRGEPSTDDMEQAQEILGELIEGLESYLQGRQKADAASIPKFD